MQHAFELSGSQWLRLTLQRGHISVTLGYFKLVIDSLDAAHKAGRSQHLRQFVSENLTSQSYHAFFCRDIKGAKMRGNSPQTRSHSIYKQVVGNFVVLKDRFRFGNDTISAVLEIAAHLFRFLTHFITCGFYFVANQRPAALASIRIEDVHQGSAQTGSAYQRNSPI